MEHMKQLCDVLFQLKLIIIFLLFIRVTMPFFCCIPKKEKARPEKTSLEEILLVLCESYIPAINACVISFSNGFYKSLDWEYSVVSDYENDSIVLKIDIKNKVDTLVSENDVEDDCVVCTNSTNQKIKCCNQPICLTCLKEIKTRCVKEDMCFSCPMCRKDLDNSVTNYKFDKEFLGKLSKAGENKKLKINIIKEALLVEE